MPEEFSDEFAPIEENCFNDALDYLATAGFRAADALVALHLARDSTPRVCLEPDAFPVREAQMLIESISALRQKIKELKLLNSAKD